MSEDGAACGSGEASPWVCGAHFDESGETVDTVEVVRDWMDLARRFKLRYVDGCNLRSCTIENLRELARLSHDEMVIESRVVTFYNDTFNIFPISSINLFLILLVDLVFMDHIFLLDLIFLRIELCLIARRWINMCVMTPIAIHVCI